MAVGTIETEAQLEAFVRQRLDGWIGSLVQRVAGSGLLLRVVNVLASAAGRSVSFGSQTLTWTASQQSAAATVTHNLPATPVGVWATVNSLGPAFAFVSTLGTSTFSLAGWVPTSTTSTATAYWLAIA